MASLYIKDAETNTLAERLAEERGLTKTAAVRLALTNELAQRSDDRRSTREIMEDFWQRHPLPAEPGPAPDKAFWDDLSGDL
jgi:antitoxin VapB